MSEKGKSKRPTIALILSFFAIMILSGCALWYLAHTLVGPATILLPVAATGFAASYLCKGIARRLSGCGNFLINFIVGGLLLSSLFSAAFLAGNYTLGGSGEHREEVTVERLYSKTQHRTRRVGRRYVGQGEPYKVYYMEVAFANGTRKEIHLGLTGYRGHKKGERISLDIATGFFGIPIITSDLR